MSVYVSILWAMYVLTVHGSSKAVPCILCVREVAYFWEHNLTNPYQRCKPVALSKHMGKKISPLIIHKVQHKSKREV